MKNHDPHQRAREGWGWEDLVVMCGITEAEARFIVLGQRSYMAWKARQESKAS